MTEPSESFLIEFPPEAHYVSTARIFAAGVARTYGADEDMVEDLKIAVSEASLAPVTRSAGALRLGVPRGVLACVVQ
jgi:hypothetical protein